MTAAVARVLLFCSTSESVVLESVDGELRVSPDRDADTMDIVAARRTKGGGEMRVGMNARYLLDVLRLAHGDPVTWHQNGSMDSQAFTFGADDQQRADRHYIMPVALR